LQRRLIIVFTVIAVAAAGVVAYAAWRAQPSQDANRPLKAPPHQVDSAASHAPRQKIAALGRLTPESRIIAIGMPSHERLDRLLVEEGQQVKKGDLLAYLESHAERLAEIRYAESQLRDARHR